jgi:hypothetical protein
LSKPEGHRPWLTNRGKFASAKTKRNHRHTISQIPLKKNKYRNILKAEMANATPDEWVGMPASEGQRAALFVICRNRNPWVLYNKQV